MEFFESNPKDIKSIKKGYYFSEKHIRHHKFSVGDQVTVFNGDAKHFGVIKGDEQDGCYPVQLVNGKHNYFPTIYLQHASTDKIPMWKKQVIVTMVQTVSDGGQFTLACDQDMTVKALKNRAIKIAQTKSAKPISLNPDDFKVIKLLRAEEVETQTDMSDSHRQKAQKMLDDSDLIWKSFSKGINSITVSLAHFHRRITVTLISKVPEISGQRECQFDAKDTIANVLKKAIHIFGGEGITLFALTHAHSHISLLNSEKLGMLTPKSRLQLWLIKQNSVDIEIISQINQLCQGTNASFLSICSTMQKNLNRKLNVYETDMVTTILKEHFKNTTTTTTTNTTITSSKITELATTATTISQMTPAF